MPLSHTISTVHAPLCVQSRPILTLEARQRPQYPHQKEDPPTCSEPEASDIQGLHVGQHAARSSTEIFTHYGADVQGMWKRPIQRFVVCSRFSGSTCNLKGNGKSYGCVPFDVQKAISVCSYTDLPNSWLQPALNSCT